MNRASGVEPGKPFSLRLSADERAILASRAGSLPIGTYIRDTLFKDGARSRVVTHLPSVDRQAIAQALALLGSSHLAANFNQLAKAANQGALPVTEELEAELKKACEQIRDMRDELLAALGVTKTNETVQTAAPIFNRVAGAVK